MDVSRYRVAWWIEHALLAALATCAAGGTARGQSCIDWSNRTLPAPSPREGHAMVYDSARHVTVLFGGHGLMPAPLYEGYFNETWEWNGSVWTQRFPSTSPSPRSVHAMAY